MNAFTTTSIDSQTPGIIMPEHLAWDFRISGEVLDSIHSKNKRKFLRKAEEILRENKIVMKIFPIESEEKFLLLLDFFKLSHEEKKHNYGLNREWYQRNLAKERKLESLELWLGNKLIGMKIYSYDKTGFYLSHKASLKEFDTSINIGMILDYLSFVRAKKLGYEICNVGKDTNLFGLQMQMSLYEYKVSFGMELRIANNTELKKVYFPEESIDVPFIAFSIIDGQSILLFVHPDEKNEDELKKYTPVNLPIVSISYPDFRMKQYVV